MSTSQASRGIGDNAIPYYSPPGLVTRGKTPSHLSLFELATSWPGALLPLASEWEPSSRYQMDLVYLSMLSEIDVSKCVC